MNGKTAMERFDDFVQRTSNDLLKLPAFEIKSEWDGSLKGGTAGEQWEEFVQVLEHEPPAHSA